MTRALGIVVIAACGHAAVSTPKTPSADVRAEIDQAESAEKARRHDLAREHYERAVAAAHDPPSIYFARREYAETLATWGEYPTAITHLEAALAVHAGDASAWHDLGIMRFHEQNTAGAIDALEHSIKLAPKDVRPRRSLAVLYWKAGDLAKQKAGLPRDAVWPEANASYARAAAVYQNMLALELPDRTRAAVKWAIVALAAVQRGEPPPAPPATESPSH